MDYYQLMCLFIEFLVFWKEKTAPKINDSNDAENTDTSQIGFNALDLMVK